MPRYEFSEGTSNKFWEITLDGTKVTTSYGRIGSAGQSTAKDLGTPAAAKKEYDKLIAEKTKKGYVLAGGGAEESRPVIGLEREVNNVDHPKKFVHRRIVDFEPETGLREAVKGVAYRIHIDYDSDDAFEDRWSQLIEDEDCAGVQALVIGSWDPEMGTGTSSDDVIGALVAAKDRLPELRALFLGDVIQQECEMSWIEQGDFAPAVNAYPQLEHLRVRGPKVMGVLNAPKLRSLALETGGLDRGIVASLVASNLPALEHLELWIGTDNYGANVTVADLQPILSGKLFPKLRYLGLRDSDIADEIAEAVASAPIVGRIRVLDLSLGTLGDEGAEALAASPAVRKLERLDLHHHYIAEDAAKTLRSLGIDVDLSDGQEADEDGGESYRYVSVGE